MDGAQRVRREAKTRPVAPLAAGPQAQPASRSLGRKPSSDALFAASLPAPTHAGVPTASLVSRVHLLPPIPSPPGLTYSSSEDSSSETDLSLYGGSSGQVSSTFPTPVRKDSSDSQISQPGSRQLNSSHQGDRQHSHHHPEPSHESLPRGQQRSHPLRRSASASTALRRSKSSSSLKQRHREKRVYIPHGQTVNSLLPLSFSGKFDEDGEPVFVDESEPRNRSKSAPAISAKSRPSISSKGDQTPSVPVVLHDVLNEPEVSQFLGPIKPGGGTPRSKRTLTIFDAFSFPLPPTPGMPRSPMPRSPCHRATASEGLIHSPLRHDLGTPPPVPIIKPQQNAQPLRTNSQRRHGLRPLPLVPAPVPRDTLSLGGHQRLLSPCPAPAGGVGEFESFLNLNSPLPHASVQPSAEATSLTSSKSRGVGEVVVVIDREPAPFRSAWAKDTGIDLLIEMVDAAIVA